MSPHEPFMQRALELAENGAGNVSPNPLVGAVIVKDGKVIGEGAHERFGGPHAEENALINAGTSAQGASLYVTLEPCNHTGKTGPCTEKILDYGIKKVYIGMQDPNPSVTGGGADFLRKNGIEVVSGVLEEKATEQNRFFIKHVTEQKPFVILKWAMSLDGSTATCAGDSKWISGEASRREVHRMRHRVDAVAVGIGTVLTDDPLLTCREVPGSSQPVRVVIDPHLKLPFDSRLVKTAAEVDVLVISSEEADTDIKEALEQEGVEVISLACGENGIEPALILTELHKKDMTSLLVEGGGTTAGYFIDSKQADEVAVFCAPCLIGGDSVSPIAGQGVELMKSRISVEVTCVDRFDNDVFIRGMIHYPEDCP